jgi:hypothetical protein
MKNAKAEWGSPNPDGTYSGMIGDIDEGRADLAANDITIWRHRLPAVDFSIDYDRSTLHFLLRNPKEVGKEAIIIRAFSSEVTKILQSCSSYLSNSRR